MTTMKPIKRLMVAVAGGTVLAIGLALVVVPGPAFLVIPAGLAILGGDFSGPDAGCAKRVHHCLGNVSRSHLGLVSCPAWARCGRRSHDGAAK